VAAAAAAAEVARLSDTLSRERLVSAARPLHLQNSINEGKHAAHAAELGRAEAEAKLREAHKSYAASEAQVRSLTDRLAKAQKEASRETKALSTALALGARHRALRSVVLSDGRWCVPRALERWRAAARYPSGSAVVGSNAVVGVLSPGYAHDGAAADLAAAAPAASAAASVVGAGADSAHYGAGSLGTPSLRRQRSGQRLVPSSAAVGTAAVGTGSVIGGGLPILHLLILTAMHGRWGALHAAYCRWQRVVLVLAAAEGASKYGGAGRGVEERRLTRLKLEAEAERRRLHEEHEQLAKAQVMTSDDL
jgi:hypothetical protein